MDNETLDIIFKFLIALAVIITPIIQSRVQQKLAKVVDDTHTLVNSNFGNQLQLNATMARRIADITKDPVDIHVAEEAVAWLLQHNKGQSIVDARGTPQGLVEDTAPGAPHYERSE